MEQESGDSQDALISWSAVGGDCVAETLSGALDAENAFEKPDAVRPTQSAMSVPGAFTYRFEPHSLTVLLLRESPAQPERMK